MSHKVHNNSIIQQNGLLYKTTLKISEACKYLYLSDKLYMWHWFAIISSFISRHALKCSVLSICCNTRMNSCKWSIYPGIRACKYLLLMYPCVSHDQPWHARMCMFAVDVPVCHTTRKSLNPGLQKACKIWQLSQSDRRMPVTKNSHIVTSLDPLAREREQMSETLIKANKKMPTKEEAKASAEIIIGDWSQKPLTWKNFLIKIDSKK